VVCVLLSAVFGAIARAIWRQTIIMPPFSDMVPLRTLGDAAIRGSAPLAAGYLAQAAAFASGSPAGPRATRREQTFAASMARPPASFKTPGELWAQT
jgi:hypothetical protein